MAPPSVDVTRLPKPLQDGDKSLTVSEARETYLRIERASWKSEDRTSKHMRHLKVLYPRILEADRRFQEQYDGLTTAKFTRGLSPINEAGKQLTPWQLDEMLNGGTVRSRVREGLRYHLKQKRGLDYQWVSVTSVTQTSGAPREYIYLWIEDPDDEVVDEWMAPALQKHINSCENALTENHTSEKDGSSGAISVEHSPPLVSDPPDDFFEIRKVSEAPTYPNTTGAKFVAKQLVHLPVGDYYNSERKNPPDTLIEGAALAWASPYRWFRASGGFPNLS